MTQITAINSHQLRSFCEQAEFNFSSTDDIPDFEGLLGQDRANHSLSFGLDINKPGYNLYLMGASGLGKQSLLKRLLDKKSIRDQNSVVDWCYVSNFDSSQKLKPRAIALPAGQTTKFRDELSQFIAELHIALPNIFDVENNETRQKALQDTLTKYLKKLKENYNEVEAVSSYLSELEEDIMNSLSVFCNVEPAHVSYEECIDFLSLQDYEVNVIVDNASTNYAPVIIEDNPTVQNLFGQIEYDSHMGALITDYRYIKSGALHHANGGYLIIDADKLLEQPTAWDTLKRALKKQEIKIPSIDAKNGNVSLVTLQPEVIPLEVKIILVGSRNLYNQLVEDDDFSELFKVEVDFSDTIECSKESLNQYAQVIATLVRKNKLIAFEQDAVKCVIEYGMRQIEDTTQLSTHMHSILELLIESDYWAKKEKQKTVRREDVLFAIDKQIYRADRSRSQIYDEINKGTLLIDISGEKIATVNGLFIIETGRLEFSQPARITATVRIGDGDIIDIEREVDLGGALHSKGVLILSSYLGAHYATGKPLSLAASLVFEQSYGSVDGDSATVGELCALMSAISNIPIKQSFAITGSADQHGNVQAIGGINEKIEGFFDICKQKGLTGEQGVILPATNIPHLILRDDVVDAIKNNQFFLYPVKTVDEAISLLTGLPAGKRNAEGEFPENSVNYKIEQRLLELAELKHEDHQKDEHDHDEDKESKKHK
jgi:lon-related putative ATP-dependent protease